MALALELHETISTSRRPLAAGLLDSGPLVLTDIGSGARVTYRKR